MELNLELCRELTEEPADFALVTLLSSDGSSPRGPGAKMLVTPDAIDATIGGGSLELKAMEWAREAIEKKRSARLDVDLTGKEKDSVDMACGGRVAILIQYVYGAAPKSRALFGLLADCQKARRACLWLSAIEEKDGETRVWQAALPEGEALTGELPDWARPLPAEDEKSEYRLVECGAGRWLLAERVSGLVHLYLCGGGHVGLKTAELAEFCGMNVTVFEDRAEFVTEERFPHAERVITPDYQGIFEGIPMGRNDCIVILTRGHRYDTEVLRQAVRTKAGYVGMIGSKRKVAMAMETLRQEGVPEETIAAIHSPIGLPIGAETPAEIAVCIIGEIIRETR